MIKVDYENCTGCGACVQKCPKNCISWKEEKLGFLYPTIDEEKCINCNICASSCPIELNNLVVDDYAEQEVFAAINNKEDILKQSSSGGVFPAISEWILAQAGVVYGCAYNEDMQPLGVRINKQQDMYRLQGSKYVQCDTSNSFALVEKDLKTDLLVLYSGTPCMIAGLRSFLKKEYDNLFCIDLVCHGVASSKYFLDYLHGLESEIKGTIRDIKFRDKSYNGWSLSGTYSGKYFETDRSFKKHLNYYDSYYYSYFLSGEIYRSSCYTCKYAQLSRIGDFTLGDLWGQKV
ncbi:MAG: Coenzyme F420 hydrogenase/dehydrogenase, beta subunit C-terminal domain [Oscillospiraceae bacterium]|nr:Coenzyme F420 hydrogenase/dehydrogenase, beta subunit C-terminal domain [Oscillospiraceae bacterium]